MRASFAVTLSLALAACGGAPPPVSASISGPAQSATPAPAIASKSVAPDGPEERPELFHEFEAAGLTGTIVILDTQTGKLLCSNLARCKEALVPASTYKIPHSMIALETGVIDGPDTILRWDGKQYQVAAWNQDLTFREAFRVSCLPCYQQIARKVGPQQESDWVKKLGYGNADTSGGVDRFWIWGGLRISPLEQIEFLRRFDRNQLPISDRTADLVKDIMTLDVTESYVLRAKTGAVQPPDSERELYWFVGWVEQGERRAYFATLLEGHAPGADMMALRRALTERTLKAQGLM
jgi:beta-lactamase class D